MNGFRLHFDDRDTHTCDHANLASQRALVDSSKPPVLRRSTIYAIAIAGIVAILYGALVPFDFQWQHPLNWTPPLTSVQPGDATVNILIYIPMGIFLRLLFRRRNSHWLFECMASVLLAGGLSYLTEVLQSIEPLRVSSLTDCLFNILGATIGSLLAPAFQRSLRCLHAWLYRTMQTSPYTTAATVTTLCISVCAWSPFDIRPTPTHLRAAVQHFEESWQTGFLHFHYDGGLSTMAHANKLATASTYGLLAFLLVMAHREAGRSLTKCLLYGVSQTSGLILIIETGQLFTASHAADWRDIQLGFLFTLAGTFAAAILLWQFQAIPWKSRLLSRLLLPVLSIAFLAGILITTIHLSQHGSAGMRSWLPIMSNFHRTWDHLLAEYVVAFANYALASSLFVIWTRLRQRSPSLIGCLAVAMTPAVISIVIASARTHGPADTSHLLLAVAAGIMAYRMDRAFSRPAHAQNQATIPM